MFVSTYTRKIDRRGRLTVPAAFRDELTEQGQNGFIAYPVTATEFPHILCHSHDQLAAAVSDQPDYNTAMSTELVFDSNGRVIVPIQLRDAAGIDHEVEFAGGGNTFTIYDAKTYRAKSDDLRKRVEGMDLKSSLEEGTEAEEEATASSSSWTGIYTLEERIDLLTSIGPKVLDELGEWVGEYEKRNSNGPPDPSFPEDLLDDLRELRDVLDDVIKKIDAGNCDAATICGLSGKLTAWVKSYTKAVAQAGADTAYAAPTVLGIIGLAGLAGALENTTTSLITGLFAGSIASGMSRKTSKVETDEQS